MTDQKTITVKLEDPVEFDKKTYTELTFGKLKAKHLAAMDLVKGESVKPMAMYASMAGVPLPVIQELSIDEWEKVQEETIPLLGKSMQAHMRRHLEKQEASGETPTTT
ncbi:Phage tail assembly chaperone protein, E, or 41 or 14 [Fulvimarina manganoxydans]|uniref:Phage tail assembly chaperone protein, E, or 41 or 14 n=1 Tax=Fulvimarina manganoxydans TaxID=937218 RepID=A0A1W1Z5N4_9HYPH|nr:phage tail assembly protein [Fulvimarina manganoxydans]SMC43248.1 Phage tail assembly chaperone protein, E, or 41 or 14 [Fulvimarina manganoxydans]